MRRAQFSDNQQSWEYKEKINIWRDDWGAGF
jgi:hypothetical protein